MTAIALGAFISAVGVVWLVNSLRHIMLNHEDPPLVTPTALIITGVVLAILGQ